MKHKYTLWTEFEIPYVEAGGMYSNRCVIKGVKKTLFVFKYVSAPINSIGRNNLVELSVDRRIFKNIAVRV
jgi:hypothetical protein